MILILYVKNGLPYSPVSFDIDFWEYLSIEVKLSGRDKLSLTSIYRSPSTCDINNTKLNELLLVHISQKNYTHCLVFGDFNFPKYN